MVKKLLAVCALAFLALSANAESNYMTVEKTNGSKISFLLADNPVITYKDGNLVINKDAKTTYSFEVHSEFPRIFLYLPVSQLAQILSQNRILGGIINSFHILKLLS